MNYSLTNSEYFQIKENDIIAVCMPQKGTGNHNPLKIAGHQATVTTLTYQSPTFTACSSSKFNQINVPTFNLHSDTIIHANAYIGKLSTPFICFIFYFYFIHNFYITFIVRPKQSLFNIIIISDKGAVILAIVWDIFVIDKISNLRVVAIAGSVVLAHFVVITTNLFYSAHPL